MTVLGWAEQRTSAMTVWDVGILKIYCVLFGMIVGAYIPTLVTRNVWWLAAAVLILGGRSGYRWLTAKAG